MNAMSPHSPHAGLINARQALLAHFRAWAVEAKPSRADALEEMDGTISALRQLFDLEFPQP